MKCKKLVCGCMVFMLIFGMCACGKKEKAKEAAPDLVLELPKEKENSASDSEETVSGMDEATQNEDIPEKKGILIAIDPGHQAPDVDMSAKEPNAPGSNVMKAKATGGTSGRYSGIAEYELNLAISLMLREALQNEGYDVIMTREDNETAISKNGVTYKEVAGTPAEQAELEKSYEHLCKLRDEVIEMGIIPAIKDWHSLNPNID